MWITFYLCGKAWCNVDNFVDRMWITSLFLNLLEIKQNELIRIYTYNLRSIQVRGRISTALFYSRQANFYPKNILHFWTMCNCKNPYNPGYFTFPENPPWLPEGECVPLSPTTQFSTSRPLP